MTLVAVWIRKNSNLRELVMASDSRLSGGESWDACPKIVALPRPATAIAMSGDATEAYAFLLQAMNTCSILDGHKIGRTDIGWLARSIKKVFGDSRLHVSDLPKGESRSIPNLDVVLAGWSWRDLRFEAYSYSFDKQGKLIMDRVKEMEEARPYGVYFAGDAAVSSRLKLKSLIKERGMPIPRRGEEDASKIAKEAYLDWEPLEILADQIADSTVRTVGGAPQVLKITQNLETETFVWRDLDGMDYYGGRRVLEDERYDRRIMSTSEGTIRISYSDRSITNVVDHEVEARDPLPS